MKYDSQYPIRRGHAIHVGPSKRRDEPNREQAGLAEAGLRVTESLCQSTSRAIRLRIEFGSVNRDDQVYADRYDIHFWRRSDPVC